MLCSYSYSLSAETATHATVLRGIIRNDIQTQGEGASSPSKTPPAKLCGSRRGLPRGPEAQRDESHVHFAWVRTEWHTQRPRKNAPETPTQTSALIRGPWGGLGGWSAQPTARHWNPPIPDSSTTLVGGGGRAERRGKREGLFLSGRRI